MLIFGSQIRLIKHITLWLTSAVFGANVCWCSDFFCNLADLSRDWCCQVCHLHKQVLSVLIRQHLQHFYFWQINVAVLWGEVRNIFSLSSHDTWSYTSALQYLAQFGKRQHFRCSWLLLSPPTVHTAGEWKSIDWKSMELLSSS